MSEKTWHYLLVLLLIITACSGSGVTSTDPPPDNEGGGEQKPGFEPIEETVPEGDQRIGFFLDNWQPKNISAPEFVEQNKPEEELDSRIQINTETVITQVPQTVYGNNANPYNGQMGSEPTVIGYLNDLDPHLIRFPGGNLSNVYFWNRALGNYPDDAPPADSLLDANGNLRETESYWYGKNEARWTMSLDNYYKLLEETNSKGIITVNFAYARYGRSKNPVATAAGYAADWVRYDNGRTRYWEIGNENYGSWQTGYRIDTTKNQDGQSEFISGRFYGQFASVFIDSMRAAAEQIGADIKIGTQLIERDATKAYETDIVKNWNHLYFEGAGDIADYYIVHNYYTPYNEDSSPSVILDSAPRVTKNMMGWMNETISNNGGEMKPIALTEWNIFAVGSQQKVSHTSGMHAAMVLGELIKYEYGAALRWDLVNAWDGGNDHGMFNSGRSNQSAPNVKPWNPRPDFFHMYYFQKYFGDRMVWSGTQGDKALKSYASTFSSGQIGLVVANTSNSSKTFDVKLKSSQPGDRYFWHTLTGGNKESFSRKLFINGKGPSGLSGGPENYESIKTYSATTDGEAGIKLSAPPRSVIYILIE